MKIFEALNQTTNLKSQFSRNDGKLVVLRHVIASVFHFTFKCVVLLCVIASVFHFTFKCVV